MTPPNYRICHDCGGKVYLLMGINELMNERWQRCPTCADSPKPGYLQIETCMWKEDSPEWNTWLTECGEVFEFSSDGPKENSFKFCPYCGKALREEEDADKD